MVPEPFAAQIRQACQELDGAPPQDVLRWAVSTYFPKLTMATAFGAEGCCLIHMLAEIEPRVRLFNLDTGYQFAETLELRERIRERYGICVEFIRPEMTVAEYEAEHGGPLYVIRSDQCCYDRKILPLRRVAAQESGAQRARGREGFFQVSRVALGCKQKPQRPADRALKHTSNICERRTWWLA